MPGSIRISATEPPAIDPLFLKVAVGKREYSGNIEQDGLSFPVTSLRESMVITMYNVDRELISKSELKTKLIVESGTMDVTFTLDTGGKIILQMQFLLNNDDRKRIQEMRNSAIKRKQQELLGDISELNFPDSPLSKQLIEKISNIQSRGDDRPKLRKSMSLDDLQERAVFSGINVDSQMKASRDLLLQRGVKKSTGFEDSSGSEVGSGKPESKSSSSVKKMISAFEGTSPKGLASETGVSISLIDSGSTSPGLQGLSSETGVSISVTDSGSTSPGLQGLASVTGVSISLTDSGSTQAGKAVVPFGDNKSSNYRSGKTVLFQHKNSSAPGQTVTSSAVESRRDRMSSVCDGSSKQDPREIDLRRSQAKNWRSKLIGSYSLVQMLLRDYPLNYLVATSSTCIHPHVCVTSAARQLKELLELEHLNSLAHVGNDTQQESTSDNESVTSAQTPSDGLRMLNGWLVNQGVRAALLVVACGALFLNNR